MFTPIEITTCLYNSPCVLFSNVCVYRTSGAIYIPYCRCEMLPVLPAYLVHFYAPGNAIRTSPSVGKHWA